MPGFAATTAANLTPLRAERFRPDLELCFAGWTGDNHELRCAPNLGVENLIAPRMPGDRLTVRVLLQALEEIARSRNLDCLSVRLPIAYMRSSTPPPLREVLEEEGFQSVAVQMHKTLNKNGKSRNGGSFFG